MAEGKDTHTVTNPQTSQGENGLCLKVELKGVDSSHCGDKPMI